MHRATIFADSKKRTLWEEGGGGGGGGGRVSYFTIKNFFMYGGPLIKCNSEKKISISNLRLPHFIHHSREMGSILNPLPDYSKSIKYSYHQFYARKSII